MMMEEEEEEQQKKGRGKWRIRRARYFVGWQQHD